MDWVRNTAKILEFWNSGILKDYSGAMGRLSTSSGHVLWVALLGICGLNQF